MRTISDDLLPRLRNSALQLNALHGVNANSTLPGEAAEAINALQDALKDALDEWESNLHYKGEYLSEKHSDRDFIAQYRQLLPALPTIKEPTDGK